MYVSLGECARKRNLSVEGVESPNFKECRRVIIAVEVLLQRGPGAPEPPDEAVERLVSRGPDMGMEPEQGERERAVVLAKAVKTTAGNGLLAGGGLGSARSWIGTGTLFGAAYVATRLSVSNC